MNDPEVIDQILRSATTIAVMGMSDKPERASFNIGRYLMAHGFYVLPVNPMLAEVLGVPCYPSLEAAQAAATRSGAEIDLVNVFRSSEFVGEIVDDVLRLGLKSLWLQDGVENPVEVARARAAGVKVVENDCILRRHQALAALPPR